jgi:hypothetical protein
MLLERIIISFVGLLFLFFFSWLLISDELLYALVIGVVFTLFSAEHIFNFIKRTRIRGIHNLSGTVIQRPVSLILPVLILLGLFSVIGI